MTKQIAVLLTVFNRKQQTLLCLDRLFRQEIPEGYAIKVYLTDDGSTDDTSAAIQEHFPGKVNIIQGDGNLYWNRGMWTAWNAAATDYEYDYYLWLNDDTLIYCDSISELLKVSVLYKDEAIIVGATTDSETQSVLTYGGKIKNSIAPCCGKNIEIDYFNGNIVLVPLYAYKILGNLDYYFTHSKGDFDYGLRAKKTNIKMYQCGKVLGVCDRHPKDDKCWNAKLSLRERWNLLHMPNGMPPKETFHLNLRHYGVFVALRAYILIYLHCIFPNLWVVMGKSDKNKMS